jgi:hypothetical protein
LGLVLGALHEAPFLFLEAEHDVLVLLFNGGGVGHDVSVLRLILFLLLLYSVVLVGEIEEIGRTVELLA